MEDTTSLVTYLLFFAFSLCGSFIYNKDKSRITIFKKIIYFIWIAGPIILLQGFRYNVGSDYESYISLYKGFSEGNALFISWYMNEPLFVYMCKFLYSITKGYLYSYFIVDAFLMNLIVFLTFDYYKQYSDISILYVTYYLLCFPYFLNLERQGLAVVLVWYATKYVHEKKIWKFIFWVVIAALFHNTAIIGLLLYAVNWMRGRYGKAMREGVLLVGIMIPLLFQQILNFASDYLPIFQKYTKFLNSGSDELLNVNFMYMFAMYAVIFVLKGFMQKTKVDNYWIALIGIAQMATYLLNNYIDWGFRMSFYFEIGLMYCYAHIYTQLKYKANRFLFMIFLLGATLFYFVYKFYVQGNSEIFPYEFVWSSVRY